MTTPHVTETRRAGLARRTRPLRCMSDLHLRCALEELYSRPVTADTERGIGLILDEQAARDRAS